MKHARNTRLVLDYLHGAPGRQLAEREGISVARVYQILDRYAQRFGGVVSIKYANRSTLASRLRLQLEPRQAPGEQATTPEAFWTEMNDEPRHRHLG